ncbi:MAG TPA: HEPN domain-containing protein [Solirubrobacterales bacterium]|jgi:HEPN domain-containing protein|nr:HEPN domain-containing protein [Solirubrobacterales bacterium]
MAGSSPSPESLEVATLLARRAGGDLKVVQKLSPDPEIDESAVGFHAQQAIEKALKVALTLQGTDFPKTHDLEFLVGLASRQSIDVPEEVAAAGWLTPWGTDFRYDDEPLHTLDRNAAIELASSAVAWCERLLAEA